MNNTVQTKTTYPVSLSEAKKHLNIESDFTDDDSYITQLIKEATSNAENYIDGDIALTSSVYTVYDFGGSVVTVGVAPFISIEDDGFSYLDDDNNAVVLNVNNKAIARIQKGLQKFKIILESVISTEELTITFASGYAANGAPEAIKRAILLQIGDWFDVERGSLVSKSFNNTDAFYRTLNFYKKSSY